MRRSIRTDARQRDKGALDRLFSRKVKARDGYRCRLQACGSGTGIECAHLFGCAHSNTRWDFENAWTLCQKHHFYYTTHPVAWTELLIATLGQEAYQALQAKAFTIVHPDYAAVRVRLEAA